MFRTRQNDPMPETTEPQEPTVVHCDCPHEREDARYLDLTQVRDTLLLAGTAYAVKTLIDVAGNIAVIAAQNKMIP